MDEAPVLTIVQLADHCEGHLAQKSKMADKRKRPSSSLNGSPYAKRSRWDGEVDSSSNSKINAPQPRNDPFYGQKHAFPGLDDGPDEDYLSYGPPEDGLEYLRMVR